MLDEKKSGETWQDVQAEVPRHDHSDPLTNGSVELDVIAVGEDRVSFFVWLLVACSGISGLLFGEFFSSRLASGLRSLTSQCVVNLVNPNRLRHRRDLWCACYHRFRPWSNGALVWSKGLPF